MIGDLYLGSGESRRRLAIYCLKASRWRGAELWVVHSSRLSVMMSLPLTVTRIATDAIEHVVPLFNWDQSRPITTGHPFCPGGCVPPNATHGEVVVYVSCHLRPTHVTETIPPQPVVTCSAKVQLRGDGKGDGNSDQLLAESRADDQGTVES